MKIELTIDRMKKLPDGAIPALESELLNSASSLMIASLRLSVPVMMG
jgi:hypothetical protein